MARQRPNQPYLGPFLLQSTMKNGIVKATQQPSDHTLVNVTYYDTQRLLTACNDQGGENVRDHYVVRIFV
ncbi:MAG: hypothetical protein AB1Z50_01395, partial [Desulfuromonadales bacterium]